MFSTAVNLVTTKFILCNLSLYFRVKFFVSFVLRRIMIYFQYTCMIKLIQILTVLEKE